MGLRLRHFHKIVQSPAFVLITLLLFGGVGYVLLIPFLGYYGDDWSMVWLAYRSHHLEIFFSGNRPLLAYYYTVMTKILGPAPWQWQVYAFICHWLCAVVFWRLVSTIWPQRKDMAAAAAILLFLYPGFWLSSEALTFNVAFIQLTIFLGSLLATIYSLKRPHQALFWSLLALTGALLNLVISEYWFFVELVRLALIGFILAEQEPNRKRLIRRTFLRGLPYLAVMATVLLARVLNIGKINSGNAITFFVALGKNPISALLGLVLGIAQDLWFTILASFGYTFTLPGLAGRSRYVVGLISVVLLASGILTFLWLRYLEKSSEDSTSKTALTTQGYLLAGLAWLLLAGLPLWLVNLKIGLEATSTRLSLPFMPGACLFVVGLVSLLNRSGVRKTAFATLIAFSAIFQLLNGSTFVRQKSLQENFLWQLALRMPSIKPGTLLQTEKLELDYNGQNSNSAMVNWMYTPPGAASQDLQYYLMQFSELPKAPLRNTQPGEALSGPHMIGHFHARHQIALVYQPPSCMRVLDPHLDEHNPYLSTHEQKAAAQTDFSAIQPAVAGSPLPRPPVEIFGNHPPPDGWCVSFQKASIAAQMGDWVQVTQIADRAFRRGGHPHNAMELVVYIEGYAYQGDWEQSAKLLIWADELNPELKPIICRLKQRLVSNTQPSSGRDQALAVLNCP